MSKQYDNLADIHADSELIAAQFKVLLLTPFSAKNIASPRILAACIRLSSLERNLEYAGAYLKQQMELDGDLLELVPQALVEGSNFIALAQYAIRACKCSRIPLSP